MGKTRIKMCGMVRPDDVALAALAGADAVGVILHPGGRRSVDPVKAWDVAARADQSMMKVAVFVNETVEQIKAAVAASGVTAVQLHGDEGPDIAAALAPLPVIKAVRVEPGTLREMIAEWNDAWSSGRIDNWTALLLEAPGAGGEAASGEAGGTGRLNDFDLIAALDRSGAFVDLPPLVIAGGLTPGNVFDVVRLLRPWGVDVSSGIETDVGRKSGQKMTDFVAAVRAADFLPPSPFRAG